MQELNVHNLRQIDRYRWLVPRQGKMRTDGMVFLDKRLLEHIKNDKSITQVANVAWLPGIVGRSLAMPDMHQGYGFPIGGVAAFDPERGVVSPGGVGYDINCGVRLLRSSLSRDEVIGEVENLVTTLFANVPSGVGSKQRNRKLDKNELKQVLNRGAQWAVQNGFGTRDDLLHIEESGCLDWADPAAVSDRALERGQAQLGTLGSGNHFVEIGFVETVFEEELAQGIGLFPGQVTIIIHTGSRGLGHQVCSDFLRLLQHASRKYGYELPDRELCCAPVHSPEGQEYLAAMAAAANFAFANRQLITAAVRRTFEQVFGLGASKMGMELVYDVCHNIAKFETHEVEGRKRELLVHRKGATRAFPAHHPKVPEAYQQTGQPVLIPGDMGRYSYVLVGTDRALRETFGSTCHGAGRLLSRHAAKKAAKGHNVVRELADMGVVVRGAGRATLVEEIPEAYKDVEDVVRVVHEAGIARKVARLRPLGVIKG
ncbi:MAG: RtcB family protein [Deltaproteobacteria bacterium]|jgi:tRNA-splicing ligase RtcB|nr:RtcB family protein [Deltaproteobacteria bacterium]